MIDSKIDGFRLGIYVFEDAEVVDFAAPYGVFSVARRYDPALDVFLVAETFRPVQAQAGFTVLTRILVEEGASVPIAVIGDAGTAHSEAAAQSPPLVPDHPERTVAPPAAPAPPAATPAARP